MLSKISNICIKKEKDYVEDRVDELGKKNRPGSKKKVMVKEMVMAKEMVMEMV